NIKAVLAFAGSSLDRAVKCTVFLADIQDFAAMNAVYATYFPKDPPARSTVAASGLAGGARVEIECIATAGETEAALATARSPCGATARCPGSEDRWELTHYPPDHSSKQTVGP